MVFSFIYFRKRQRSKYPIRKFFEVSWVGYSEGELRWFASSVKNEVLKRVPFLIFAVATCNGYWRFGRNIFCITNANIETFSCLEEVKLLITRWVYFLGVFFCSPREQLAEPLEAQSCEMWNLAPHSSLDEEIQRDTCFLSNILSVLIETKLRN